MADEFAQRAVRVVVWFGSRRLLRLVTMMVMCVIVAVVVLVVAVVRAGGGRRAVRVIMLMQDAVKRPHQEVQDDGHRGDGGHQAGRGPMTTRLGLLRSHQ